MSKLTYQDCVDLKEAGFPQGTDMVYYQCSKDHGNSSCFFRYIGQRDYLPSETLILCDIPYLDELIDECRSWRSVEKLPSEKEEYSATSFNGTRSYGTSPEQAVKKLYCSLKKLSTEGQ